MYIINHQVVVKFHIIIVFLSQVYVTACHRYDIARLIPVLLTINARIRGGIEELSALSIILSMVSGVKRVELCVLGVHIASAMGFTAFQKVKVGMMCSQQ